MMRPLPFSLRKGLLLLGCRRGGQVNGQRVRSSEWLGGRNDGKAHLVMSGYLAEPLHVAIEAKPLALASATTVLPS